MIRFLVLTGILVVVLGLILHFQVEIPWYADWIGRLPGDILIRKKNVTIYLPVATSLLISTILSILCYLIFRRSK